MIPRKNSLWVGRSTRDQTDGSPPRFSLVRWLTCRHPSTVRWAWINYRSGPGWMADSYEADLCTHCGRALDVRKSY